MGAFLVVILLVGRSGRISAWSAKSAKTAKTIKTAKTMKTTKTWEPPWPYFCLWGAGESHFGAIWSHFKSL